MAKKKLLILSDSVSGTSGLGRITRDLTMRIHEHLSEFFDVATLGYGGNGSIKYPWQQYHLHSIQNWLVPELPAVWSDFVGEEDGILMVIWDMSRLYWLGMPQTCPDPSLRHWVETLRKAGKLKLWAYHAIDAEGPLGTVPTRIRETMKGFDRVLDYSEFSSRITGNPEHLPHGIDPEVFHPDDHAEARKKLIANGFMGLKEDSLLLGIVSTNQARKNWQLGMETCRILLDWGRDVRLWAHTDVLQRYWDIGSLVVDYGLQGRAAITTQRFTDDQMVSMYSACDCTLGIAPEGFGYPIAESLACGVPCVAGNYGAQSEFVPESMRIEPTGYYYEGAFCSKRPVHSARLWANRVDAVLDARSEASLLPSSLEWENLWPQWRSWFLEGR